MCVGSIGLLLNKERETGMKKCGPLSFHRSVGEANGENASEWCVTEKNAWSYPPSCGVI